MNYSPPRWVLAVIIVAQFSGTSLWFAGNAILPELNIILFLNQYAVSLVTTAIMLGFISGTLIFAFLGLAGRANESWFKDEKEGLYYGQCSELCGMDHAFMPIAVRVFSEQQYETWLAAARTDLPGANKALMAQLDGTNKVASAGN